MLIIFTLLQDDIFRSAEDLVMAGCHVTYITVPSQQGCFPEELLTTQVMSLFSIAVLG